MSLNKQTGGAGLYGKNQAADSGRDRGEGVKVEASEVDQQVAEDEEDDDFECSLQTVLELSSEKEDEVERQKEAADSVVETEVNDESGTRSFGLVWRKIVQANSTISRMKQIAQEKGSKYKQQLVGRMGSSSSSSSATPLAAADSADQPEPEFISSRRLRQAQIQM